MGMKDGVCPQCGSTEVYWHEPPTSTERILIGWTGVLTHSAVYLAYYICTECGYVESYVIDEKALNQISEHWPRADARKKKNNE
jgi:hypothetical protein